MLDPSVLEAIVEKRRQAKVGCTPAACGRARQDQYARDQLAAAAETVPLIVPSSSKCESVTTDLRAAMALRLLLLLAVGTRPIHVLRCAWHERASTAPLLRILREETQLKPRGQTTSALAMATNGAADLAAAA